LLNQYSWEMPEGGGPEGTDPLESAKRELLEETGLKPAVDRNSAPAP
jgi:ADP-ribose pyrophosphatase